MQLVIDRELASGPSLAVRKLAGMLNLHGETVRVVDAAGEEPSLLIGKAESSDVVATALARSGLKCPSAPESVLLSPLSPDQFLIAGSDERGLIYAILEAARAIQVASPTGGRASASILDYIPTEIGSPYLSWRSMQLFLCNRELEREWFYNGELWDEYLDQLALYRYNNLSLTFGHQIAYMSPPYPFLLDLPEFSQVRALDYSPEQRRDCLNMLRRVSASAQLRGLHFTLGIWSQHAHDYGEPMVGGLTPDILAAYNAAGLARVLAECPDIDGVQFRMNEESGIDEDRQAEFYEPQFCAIAECGRPIRLDLRAKGLAESTIDLARGMVPNTVVSTKHWCEHLGMPYSMPMIQRRDHRSYRRYGTWDLLRKPRTYPLIHRLWSAGSQRVLLWGEPEWVKRFVGSCAASGDGFEVMAPLTNKGVRDQQPAWLAYSDRTAYRGHAEERERFWLFCLLFGRLGYDPDAAPELWRRELRHRVGKAAGATEQLYMVGSQILPLLTTVLQMSASLWTFWPERYAGRSLDEDARVEPSDPTRFYRVDEYVEDMLKGRLCGKWTPLQVAEHLRQLAGKTRTAIALIDQTTTELRYTCLDFTILSHLAEYHASRMAAGTYLALYRRTDKPGLLPAVLQHLEQSREQWGALSVAADGNYADDLVFGFRDKGHCGHWKDDLAVVERDLGVVRRLLEDREEEEPTQVEWHGGTVHPHAPGVDFRRPLGAEAGEDLPLRLDLKVSEERSVRAVRCFHRIAHQALEFEMIEMRAGEGSYEAVIPGDAIDAAWDLMLFFEFEFSDGLATRWPDWRTEAPYFVIPTR